MRPQSLIAILGLAAVACTGGTNPEPPAPVDPFEITLADDQICSDTVSVPESGDATHVADASQFNHNTDPPTSGRHFAEWITPTRVYDQPLADGNTVHNLEHGHVYVQHNDVSDEELDAIITPVRSQPVMTLAAPRPDMPWKLALTSWTRIKVCREIPEDVTEVVQAFINENRDSGAAPESAP